MEGLMAFILIKRLSVPKTLFEGSRICFPENLPNFCRRFSRNDNNKQRLPPNPSLGSLGGLGGFGGLGSRPTAALAAA